MPSSNRSRPSVVLYTRTDCELCDDVKVEVERARERRDFSFQIRDVDQDPELREKYGEQVPVVEVNGRKAFKYRMTQRQLLRRLAFGTWF